MHEALDGFATAMMSMADGVLTIVQSFARTRSSLGQETRQVSHKKAPAESQAGPEP